MVPDIVVWGDFPRCVPLRCKCGADLEEGWWDGRDEGYKEIGLGASKATCDGQ